MAWLRRLAMNGLIDSARCCCMRSPSARIYPRAPTYPCTPRPNSARWPTGSTTDHARALACCAFTVVGRDRLVEAGAVAGDAATLVDQILTLLDVGLYSRLLSNAVSFSSEGVAKRAHGAFHFRFATRPLEAYRGRNRRIKPCTHRAHR